VKAPDRLLSAACSRQNAAKAQTHLRSSVRHFAYDGEAFSRARWVTKKDMARGAASAADVGPMSLIPLYFDKLH